MADVTEPSPEGQKPEAEAPPAAEPAVSESSVTSVSSRSLDDVDPEHTPPGFLAPSLLPLDRIIDDGTFRFRSQEELADVSALATDIARLGQLFPIDVRLIEPDQFQIVTGYRRVAALRMLLRERVLARLHTDLSDADALSLALAAAIHGKPVSGEELAAIRERLDRDGKLTPGAREMLDKALATESTLAPEAVEEEVDADELAADAATRLGEINQDLALLADVFTELEPARREELLKQLKYSADLVAFLEGQS